MDTLPNTPIIEGEDVFVLIPQKAPMVMIDKLWFNGESKTISGFHILSTNIFCEHGYFREPGIIENMAQTAALRVGYMVSQMEKKGEKVNPPTGYIGAIKKLNISKMPAVGDEIVTEITIQHVIFDVTLIKAHTRLSGETIAECEMKIFLKKD